MPDTKILEKITESKPRYNLRTQYRDYYDGLHATMLTARQRAYLQIKTGQEFNDNYCPVVVDALAERLSVTGFTVTGADEKQADTQSALFGEWWKASRMDETQGDTHTAAIRDGDAYAIVEWDQEHGRPSISFEYAFDGSEGVETVYDPNRRRRALYGWKRWKGDEVEFLNVYYPDRVEKYQFVSEDWQQISSESWPSLVVPVIHFRNNAGGYNYGRSELHNVIPQQNALNKAIIDLVAAADTTGFRLYWMTGGDPGEQDVVPGSWIYSTDANARLGAIPGEDLSKLIQFRDAFVMEIARVSRTPLSFFQLTGQVAAEGTLKQQESGLLARVNKRQIDFGNSWEDVMSLCRRLHNIHSGDPVLDENATIETQWKDAETRDDLGRLQELKIKGEMGIPEEQLWSEMGYTKAQIEDFKNSAQHVEKRQQSRYSLLEGAARSGVGQERALADMGYTPEQINEILYGEVEEQ